MISSTSFPYQQDLPDVARKLGRWTTGIEIKASISSGKSKEDVWLVDVIFNRDAYRNELLDRMLEQANAGSDQSWFDILCVYLDYNRDSSSTQSDTLPSEIARLFQHSSTPSSSAITIERLAEAFVRLFPEMKDEFHIILKGPHYLKLHRDATNQENLRAYDNLQNSDPGIASQMAKLACWLVYNGRLWAFYEPALDSVNPMQVISFNKVDAVNDVKASIESVQKWLRQLQRYKYVPAGNAITPLALFREILKERRVSGSDSVQQRMVTLLGNAVGKDDPSAILDARQLKFEQYTLPNTIGYLEHPDYWLSPDSKYVIPTWSAAHGDLHGGNIICQKLPHLSRRPRFQSEVPPIQPDIIDFGDFQETQSIFFDLLYLELDLILQRCKPEDEKSREYLLEFVIEYLTGDGQRAAIPESTHGLPMKTALLPDWIRPLRDLAQDIIAGSDREEDTLATFWITATAVGLNFARKSTLTKEEKLLSLMYAGAALRHVLAYQGIEWNVARSNVDQDVVSLPWINIQFTHKRVSEEKLIEELSRTLFGSDADEKVYVFYSPRKEEQVRDERNLLEALQVRLGWVKSTTDVPDNLGDAFGEYREYASEPNLTATIQSYYRQKTSEDPLVPRFADLAMLEKVMLVFMDWGEELESQLYAAATLSHMGLPGNMSIDDVMLFHDLEYAPFNSPVIRLCGHINWPRTICHPNDRELPEQTQAWLRTLKEDIETGKAHILFLGWHDFDNQIYADILQMLAKRHHNQTGLWHVRDDRPSKKIEHLQVTYAETDPHAFLQKLNIELGCHNTNQRLSPFTDFDTFRPREINYDDILSEIIPMGNSAVNGRTEHLSPSRWFFYSLPDNGKSAFLRRLREEHFAWYEKLISTPNNQPLTTPVSALVNLAEDTRLARSAINILLLLYDRFRLQVPRCSDPFKAEDAKRDELQGRFVEDISTRWLTGSKILICIDSLDYAEGNTIPPWLANSFAPALAKREEELRQIDLLLVVTRRLNAHSDSPPSYLKKQWPGFEVRKLPSLTTRDVEGLLLEIIKKAPLPPNRDKDMLENNLRFNTMQARQNQAKTYLEFCHRNINAVIALLKEHIKTNNLMPFGNWPSGVATKGEIYSIIYAPILKNLESFVKYRYPEQRAAAHLVLIKRLLLSRSLNRSLVEIIFRQGPGYNSSLLPTTILAGLHETGYLYTRGAGQGQFFNGHPSDWYYVVPSYHSIMRDFFRFHEDSSVQAQFLEVFVTAFNVVYEHLTQLERSDRERYEMVLEATYYYYYIYHYCAGVVAQGNAQASADAFDCTTVDQRLHYNIRDITPAEQLLDFVEKYLVADTNRLSLSEVSRQIAWLREDNQEIQPELPEDIFDEAERIAAKRVNYGP